jgi:hypothetical protein
MNEKSCRTEIRIILRDLSSKSIKLTGAQRYRLHERVAQLQEELRLLEIEKLERQEPEAQNRTSERPLHLVTKQN